MGIQDRDYWRDWKREQEAGSVDPTHWREDELRTSAAPVGGSGSHPDPGDTLRFWSKVLAFLVVAALMVLVLRSWREQQSLKQAEAAAQKTASDLREKQELLQQAAAAQALSADRRQKIEDDARKLRAANREAIDQTFKREAQAKDQKAAAWERYFKPSALCQREAATVDCANEHIRARRAFDASYKGRASIRQSASSIVFPEAFAKLVSREVNFIFAFAISI